MYSEVPSDPLYLYNQKHTEIPGMEARIVTTSRQKSCHSYNYSETTLCTFSDQHTTKLRHGNVGFCSHGQHPHREKNFPWILYRILFFVICNQLKCSLLIWFTISSQQKLGFIFSFQWQLDGFSCDPWPQQTFPIANVNVPKYNAKLYHHYMIFWITQMLQKAWKYIPILCRLLSCHYCKTYRPSTKR